MAAPFRVSAVFENLGFLRSSAGDRERWRVWGPALIQMSHRLAGTRASARFGSKTDGRRARMEWVTQPSHHATKQAAVLQFICQAVSIDGCVWFRCCIHKSRCASGPFVVLGGCSLFLCSCWNEYLRYLPCEGHLLSRTNPFGWTRWGLKIKNKRAFCHGSADIPTPRSASRPRARRRNRRALVQDCKVQPDGFVLDWWFVIN